MYLITKKERLSRNIDIVSCGEEFPGRATGKRLGVVGER